MKTYQRTKKPRKSRAILLTGAIDKRLTLLSQKVIEFLVYQYFFRQLNISLACACLAMQIYQYKRV